jgi:hypothetical protein
MPSEYECFLDSCTDPYYQWDVLATRTNNYTEESFVKITLSLDENPCVPHHSKTVLLELLNNGTLIGSKTIVIPKNPSGSYDATIELPTLLDTDVLELIASYKTSILDTKTGIWTEEDEYIVFETKNITFGNYELISSFSNIADSLISVPSTCESVSMLAGVSESSPMNECALDLIENSRISIRSSNLNSPCNSLSPIKKNAKDPTYRDFLLRLVKNKETVSLEELFEAFIDNYDPCGRVECYDQLEFSYFTTFVPCCGVKNTITIKTTIGDDEIEQTAVAEVDNENC